MHFIIFLSVTGIKCSYGKISSPLTEIPVGKPEISVTEPARPLIWTHQSFYKGSRSKVRSRKPGQPGQPGSYEEALSQPVSTVLSRWLVQFQEFVVYENAPQKSKIISYHIYKSFLLFWIALWNFGHLCCPSLTRLMPRHKCHVKSPKYVSGNSRFYL